jgi:asparaginyl-tRNA synthetase
MRLNEDEQTVRAMDVLFPGIGEIVGGSQREERLDVLERKINAMGIDPKELWWYLDLRKFGTAVHSGFGLGFERLVMFATGMGNIRDVIPYPRTPQNAEF